MAKRIAPSATFPQRQEQHANANWMNLGFNHKTTTTMGLLTPIFCEEVYPGEKVRLRTTINKRFAALYLPIMHQCLYTIDFFYVTCEQLYNDPRQFRQFMSEDPLNPQVEWAWATYARAKAIYTDGILNYMGFNAPPGAGTLISGTVVGAMPIAAYMKIYDEYYRNDQIQLPIWYGIDPGDNTTILEDYLPGFRAKRRNWPRDYYTSATNTPILGENVLIPSFATDPESGQYIAQKLFQLDGDIMTEQALKGWTTSGDTVLAQGSDNTPVVLQLSSTIADFRYANDMQLFLERHLRTGGVNGSSTNNGVRWNDFVKANFNWTPNPLYIDRPVWIGGYQGDVFIQEVMSTAEVGDFTVGQYAGQALAMDGTPYFSYTAPDYGFVMGIYTCYPKASYYSGLDNMWRRESKMSYMWEQFAYIGDQPIRNKEVWFSWYTSDAAWNEEIFGYLPQGAQFRYNNDIVSGQMRTLWESFHLGRKFTAASQVVLNSDFITCTPDIGRVFVVDAEAGEHEIYMHMYNDIQILRKYPKSAIPSIR